MKPFTRLFPVLVVLILGLYCYRNISVEARTYTHGELDLNAFAALPVLDGGRIKPLDSVARMNMLFISGRSEFKDDKGDTQPAILWLLESMASGDPDAGPAADYRIFRVDNEQLLEELGLEYRPGSYRYSWKEIHRDRGKIYQLYLKAKEIEEKKRDLFHGKVLELVERMVRYEQIAEGRSPTVIPLVRGGEEWESLLSIDESLVPASVQDNLKEKAFLEIQDEMTAAKVDPRQMKPGLQFWWLKKAERRLRASIREYAAANNRRLLASPADAQFHAILKAFKDNRPKAFSEAVATFRTDYVEPVNPNFRDTTALELRFNKLAPFHYAAFMYVFAGVFAALGWLGWTGPFRKAAMGLALFAVFLHGFGLLGRMYLMGRPLVFVTNLYSSALMIGFAAVVGAFIMETVFKNGIGLVVGTTIGASTVEIAHFLATDGKDNLGMLQAVLDTNFWLASHVTTVTLGYSATYFAGMLGLAYIVWGLFFTTLTREKHTALGNMIYGVTCFALLFSFIGTVLGGIWADQSWGRFWGWDPKENGAVLIVIWNALILHARWGGMVKQRGMAVLSIIGIAVTTWSWFGTNQLEVGLHAYGFNKALAAGCKWTWIGCALVVGIGMIPLQYWRSFAGTGQPRPDVTSATVAAAAANAAPKASVTAAVSSPAANGQPSNGQAPRTAKGKKGKRR